METLMDSNVLFIIAVLSIIGIVTCSFFRAKKDNQINPDRIIPIVTQAIESLFDAKKAKDDFEGLIEVISKQIKLLLDSSDLSSEEKDFWTIERISNIVRNILTLTVKTVSKKEGTS